MADGDPTPGPGEPGERGGGPSPDGDPDGTADLWFRRRRGGLGIAPVGWQGRATTFLYLFLVLVALVTYSELAVTAFVIVFYTVVFGFVLVVKSDLLEHWPPGS